MTGRELVERAMSFRSPERIPKAKGWDADMAIVGYGPARDFRPQKKGMDEWGCVRVSLNPDSGDQGQVFEHPLSDWRRADVYSFPDPYAPGRFDRAGERLQEQRRCGRFVFGSLGKGPMHLLDDLRGFANYLSDIQSVMQAVPFERIGAETACLIRSLSIPDGGFVATWYDKPDLRLDQKKVERMTEAFDSFCWTI